MANRSACVFVLFLSIIIADTGNGINRMELTRNRGDKSELRHQLRYRRKSPDCRTETDKNGYFPLTKDNMKVGFFKNGNYYFAKVTWSKPKVNNSIPISAFAVTWCTYSDNCNNLDCKVVENKTSLIIKPSSTWPKDETLAILIVPLPSRDAYKVSLILFSPDYTDITDDKIKDKIIKTIIIENNNTSLGKNNDTRSNPADKRYGDNSKIVIGSVAGISIGIVLIVVLIVCHYNGGDGGKVPSQHSEFYYVSYFPESESHIKKVENFVSWLRVKGFDVEMDRMLSVGSEKLLREIGRFRFVEVQMSKAKNVIMIVSPSYLRLCRLDERDQGHENLSQDEKIVNLEIVYIRNDLYSTVFRNDKFIPILFDVQEAGLPFWIKELLLYTWPEDKMNDRLLYRLHNQPEYLPEKPGLDT